MIPKIMKELKKISKSLEQDEITLNILENIEVISINKRRYLPVRYDTNQDKTISTDTRQYRPVWENINY